MRLAGSQQRGLDHYNFNKLRDSQWHGELLSGFEQRRRWAQRNDNHRRKGIPSEAEG